MQIVKIVMQIVDIVQSLHDVHKVVLTRTLPLGLTRVHEFVSAPLEPSLSKVKLVGNPVQHVHQDPNAKPLFKLELYELAQHFRLGIVE